jgi:hypothetical protein
MRLVRIVNFVAFGQMPVIAVVRKDELTVSVEELISTWKQKDPTTLILVDEMEVQDDASDEQVGKAMADRFAEKIQTEGNMAAVFVWAASNFARLTPLTGVMSMKSLSPLTVEELEIVLKQVIRHPAYAKQTVVTFSKDGRVVRVVNGTIQSGDMKM